MVKALGGNPTPILAYGELYTALQQGGWMRAENNIPSQLEPSQEVSKYFSLGWAYDGSGCVGYLNQSIR